jgi:hypothetical protein
VHAPRALRVAGAARGRLRAARPARHSCAARTGARSWRPG